MKGLELLLKAFKIDPAMVKNEVAKAAANFNATQKHFDDKLNVIIANQNRIAAGMNIQLVTHDKQVASDAKPN